jgi:Ca2+-binding EF-hand superfamily protein
MEMAKQNFNFYCQSKKSGNSLELFELPMVLSACGWRTSPEMLS